MESQIHMALGKCFSSHLAHNMSFRIMKLDLGDRRVSQLFGHVALSKIRVK